MDDKLLKTCVVPQLKKLASDSDMLVNSNSNLTLSNEMLQECEDKHHS